MTEIEIDIPAAMEKAAEFIVQPGKFGKGRFRLGDCFCALGAYAVGLGVQWDGNLMNLDYPQSIAFDAGWQALNISTRQFGFGGVESMNDESETTAEQMASVLRETAKRLRGAEE